MEEEIQIPPALSTGVLMDLLDNRDDIEWPIFLQVLDALVVPKQNDDLVYRVWLYDGKYKTSFGVIDYADFWDQKVLKNNYHELKQHAIIEVSHLICFALLEVNRPVFNITKFEVACYSNGNADPSINLDDIFEGDLNQMEVEIPVNNAIEAPDVIPKKEVEEPALKPFKTKVASLQIKQEFMDSYDETQLLDLELEAQNQVRARLVFLSPVTWQGGASLYNVSFSTKYGLIKGTIQESIMESLPLPSLNDACILNVPAREAEDIHFRMKHFGPKTDCTDLPEVKFNFFNLIKIRSLPKDALCDVIGVVTKGPIKKDFGNKDEKKIVIYISDRTTKFELPILMWPSAIQNLDFTNNPIVAFCRARRTSLMMSSLYLRYDSMILINPDWVAEAKKLKNWSSMVDEPRQLKSLNELKEESQEELLSDAIFPNLKITAIAEGPNCHISCVNCSGKVYDLAQEVFVCKECGPAEQVQVKNLSMELRVHDGTGEHWVVMEEAALKNLLDLPDKVTASIGPPEIFLKIKEFKTRRIKARIRYLKNKTPSFIVLEADLAGEVDHL